MTEENKSYCPVPWKSVNVRNNGDFRVCCHANASSDRGLLRNPDGQPFNAKNSDLALVRNSATLKELRLAMIKGERHEICSRCNAEDEAGIKSRRVYENNFWSDSFSLPEAKRATGEDGAIDTNALPPGFFDFRFGNLCNLKCRMCGPTDSSRWLEEHFETKGSSFRDSTGAVQLARADGRVVVAGENPYDWHSNPEFWRQVERDLAGIRKIYVVGGEPLLIDRHYHLLRLLVDQGHAQNVIIEYNSNVTVIPPKALALWRNFKEVRIGASVDGHGKVNEYIRHPSKWEVIEKNLDLLDASEGPLKVWIATTVQIYNVFYLTDFLRWRLEKGFRRINSSPHSPFLTMHLLHNPPHFNVQALPVSVKKMVEDKFREFEHGWFRQYLKDKVTSEDREKLGAKMSQLLGGYLTFLKKRDLSAHLPEFWRVTAQMDNYRKENFRAMMPEIADPIWREINP